MEKKVIKSEVESLRRRVEELKSYRSKVEKWAGRVAPAITKIQRNEDIAISSEATAALKKLKRQLTDSMEFSKDFLYSYMDTFYYNKLVVSVMHDNIVKYSELNEVERPLRHILSNLDKFNSVRDKIKLSAYAEDYLSKELVDSFDDLVNNLDISSKQAIDRLEDCIYVMLREVDYM